MAQRQPSVGIIGAGMSGLCQAIVLRQAGITDVTIFEKADDVGGTWRDASSSPNRGPPRTR